MLKEIVFEIKYRRTIFWYILSCLDPTITFVRDNPFGRIRNVICDSILDNIKCYTNVVVIVLMCHIVQM
jgi:hypothetical protein